MRKGYNYRYKRGKMKKIFPALIVVLLLLSACNLPAAQPATNSDEIATRVAATLAAIPSFTETSAPTDNPIPTEEIATVTPSPTATSTITPTPTVSPDDPKLTLGNPDFWFNSASSGDPFGVVGDPYEDSAVTISNQVSGLVFESHAINLGKRWRLTSPTPTNFYLEGTFKVIKCDSKDNYGLVMRVPTYNDSLGYYVGLSCDGHYIVDRLDAGGNGINLIGWTPDIHIQTGPDKINRLGVMVANDQFKIYINDSLVTQFADSVIPNKGHVGAYVSARGNANFTVILQELMEWNQ